MQWRACTQQVQLLLTTGTAVRMSRDAADTMLMVRIMQPS
jgi:hypothetical protein